MYNDLIEIDKEEIYDILCGCNLIEVNTRDYGNITVIDEDSVMEDFIPELITYLNEKLEENKLLLQ